MMKFVELLPGDISSLCEKDVPIYRAALVNVIMNQHQHQHQSISMHQHRRRASRSNRASHLIKALNWQERMEG
jgi:hypothetical protein